MIMLILSYMDKFAGVVVSAWRNIMSKANTPVYGLYAN